MLINPDLYVKTTYLNFGQCLSTFIVARVMVNSLREYHHRRNRHLCIGTGHRPIRIARLKVKQIILLFGGKTCGLS